MIDKGTTFTIHLPSIGKEYTEYQADVALQTNGKHKGGSILVMDDDELIRDIASSILIHLGYEVTTCTNGEEAIEIYKTSVASGAPFLAIIMDLTIPGGLGGKEAAEADSLAFSQCLSDRIKRVLERPNHVQLSRIWLQRGYCQTFSIHEVEKVLGSLLTLD